MLKQIIFSIKTFIFLMVLMLNHI